MESTAPVRAFGAHPMHRKQRPLPRQRGGVSLNPQDIIRNFPSRHRAYVEPFGGASSLLLHKPRSAAEVYNDTDRDVINLFQVMRDPLKLVRLIESVRWTPLARDEFLEAAQDADDPIEQARRMLLRSWAALGCSRANRWAGATGRSAAGSRWALLSAGWTRVPEALRHIGARLSGVVIESRDPCQVIVDYDSPQTLFYVAAPACGPACCARRHKSGGVAQAEDLALAKILNEVRGHVVLRGRDSESYRDLYPGWQRVRLSRGAMDSRQHAEVLWLSPGIPQAHRIATSTREQRP